MQELYRTRSDSQVQAEVKIAPSRQYLNNYMNRFEKMYTDLVFERQESGYLHNTAEWGYWVYDCLKAHKQDALLEALNDVVQDYNPGKLSREELRSSKNLTISLISVMVHFAVRDRIIDNELALTAADVCILLCEETRTRSELRQAAYAGLCKISELMQDYENREYHYLVQQSKDYIYKHLHEEIFCRDIADSLSVSQEHLSRTFRKAEGISLKQYILDERIERACNLLRNSDYSISEIARFLALSSSSHFATVFRRKKGKSPAVYRQDFSNSVARSPRHADLSRSSER